MDLPLNALSLFWKDLKLFVVKAINCIFYNKELPISQRLGIISRLPNGDRLDNI